MSIFEQKLIEAVKQYPIIYNLKAKTYLDLDRKAAAWGKIVWELNNPELPDVKSAKSVWTRLRAGHRAYLRNMRKSPTPPVKTWRHASAMAFLLPYMKVGKKPLNQTEAKDVEDFVYISSSDEDLTDTFHEEDMQPEFRTGEMYASYSTGTSNIDRQNDIGLRCEDGNFCDKGAEVTNHQHPSKCSKMLKSNQQTQKFIETVKRYPIIYNLEARITRKKQDMERKEAIWGKIVWELNDSEIPDVKTAKKEWYALRSRHRFYLRKIRDKEAGKDLSTWKHADAMAFLIPHYTKKNTRDTYINETKKKILRGVEDFVYMPNSDEDQTDTLSEDGMQYEIKIEEMDTSNSIGTSSSLIDRQNDIGLQFEYGHACDGGAHVPDSQHPLNYFFSTMCETTKKFPTWIQRDVKKRILKIINEAEETNAKNVE